MSGPGTGRLLSGLRLGPPGEGRPGAVAAWLLRGLGAAVEEHGAPSARLLGAETAPEAGVAPGTLDYACGTALATAALAGWRARRALTVSASGVAVQVFLPEVMAAAYRSPTAMAIPAPRPAPGGGWLHADLGSPGDPERFADLLATLPPTADAPTVAAAAQEWRLPVCDYRRRLRPGRRLPITATAGPDAQPAAPRASNRAASRGAPQRGRPLGGVEVCDLTAMWAGPLATWLAAGLGAVVHKVEPDVRLDGFRAIGGGGIHPGGRQSDPGNDSAMWNALNHGKTRVALDLRDPPQRAEMIALARRCDVVVDSYSPRVMPNFGLDPLPAGPTGISMPAFPPGPQRDWVAYGSGVHAFLGLGERRDGTFAAPLVSYPDPLAGFAGALAIVAAVVARDLDAATAKLEVPLAAAAQPLLGLPGWPEPAACSPGGALLAAGSFETRSVAGSPLPHPLSPFLDEAGSPIDQNLF